DDELTVRTTIPAPPSVRIAFTYEVRNAAGVLLTEASTTLVFIDRATGRPMRAPVELLRALAPFFA
ncbi:MAG: acyl-CoA thioesterase, partial [Bacteroidetes bacterium]|nr:acyl-CoA thioesterase [Bacteroidota bacterium]